MKILDLVTRSPEQTRQLGEKLGKLTEPGDVVLLSGELGAGKTCLTQGIAWGLDIQEYALSPTFVIMREMHGRLPLYHMDLYRLDNIDESIDLGLDDYLYGKGICVVEWAEKALEILPKNRLLISITYISDTDRRFMLEPQGQRYETLVNQLEEGLHVS